MNNELLAILDFLERDKGLDREVLANLIAEALETSARKAVGPANELKVTLDPKTGDINATAKLTVVDKITEPDKQLLIGDARAKYPDVALGEEVEWEVTPKDFGRIAAQTAKQGIMQRLRQAEKMRVRDEFKERVGEVLYGVVTRFEKGDIIIDFGQAEGVLSRHERVPTEDYQIGDHICCVLVDVNINRPGPVLVVSRNAPDLVRRLFEREVSEIAEGIVEIRAVAREPGFRSKIAVHSNDAKVDPVGACVGLRGSRVKTIVRELSGEKVDIIRWDDDVKTYVKNALQPAELKSLSLNEDTKTVTIRVEPDQLSLAIGRRGQNARLTHKLTGWKIDIEREEEKVEETIEQKMAKAVDVLVETLGDAFPPEIAENLVANGFLTPDGIKAADNDDLTSIDGIDDELAEKIKAAVGA